jgi:hypothetical protein
LLFVRREKGGDGGLGGAARRVGHAESSGAGTRRTARRCRPERRAGYAGMSPNRHVPAMKWCGHGVAVDIS